MPTLAGVTACEPPVDLLPDQSPSDGLALAVQDVGPPVEDHVTFVDCPRITLAGEAEMLAVVCGFAVTDAEPDFDPPGPVQVIVYVWLPETDGVIEALEFTLDVVPDQSLSDGLALKLQLVGFPVVPHVRLADCPRTIVETAGVSVTPV